MFSPAVYDKRKQLPSSFQAKSAKRGISLSSRANVKALPMPKLSHYDSRGQARMVDVSRKSITHRTAQAHAFVHMTPKVLAAIRKLKNPKGDPLETARIAGITAAKRTSEWIPLCHPLPLTHIDVLPTLCKNGVEIRTHVSASAQTGVEMEALVAAAAAALTVYDMCKALGKSIEIRELFLVEKTGGKSGDYLRADRSNSRAAGQRKRKRLSATFR
jgi:cyclic pyranopterin monophosphate synthase